MSHTIKITKRKLIENDIILFESCAVEWHYKYDLLGKITMKKN